MSDAYRKQDKLKIILLHQRGESPSDISRSLGFPSSAVLRIIKEFTQGELSLESLLVGNNNIKINYKKEVLPANRINIVKSDKSDLNHDRNKNKRILISKTTKLKKKIVKNTTISKKETRGYEADEADICPECGVLLIFAPVNVTSPEGIGPTVSGSSHPFEMMYEIVCPKCGQVYGDVTSLEE